MREKIRRFWFRVKRFFGWRPAPTMLAMYDQEGNKLGTLVSTKDGELLVPPLQSGTYIIKEPP